jgi:signal transduction histidine kinase
MVVQAEAGPLYLTSQPEKAEAAFDAISLAGRDALAQLRRLLGVLKVEGDSASVRAPQPTLGSLPELLERVRQGGLEIAFSETGTSLPLPGDAETAVFRLVQEALTNTIKHADASRAEIALDWTEEGLHVAVSDNGRGAPAVSSGDTDALTQGGGHGLIGLRERLAAVGGTLSISPTVSGSGFTLTARIPAGA